MTDQRYCAAPGCATVLLRRKGETLYKFVRRKGCSQKCSARLASLRAGRLKADQPPKECPICHALFTRRADEASVHFTKRRTCGAKKCYSVLQSRSSNREHFPIDHDDWHRETWPIDYAGGFGRTTIDPGDTRGHIPLRPATHVQKQSSIA